jgi:hypothetical protein
MVAMVVARRIWRIDYAAEAEQLRAQGLISARLQLQHQVDEEELLGADAVQLLARRVVARKGAVLRDRVTSVANADGIFQVEPQRHVQQQSKVLVATGASPLYTRRSGTCCATCRV